MCEMVYFVVTAEKFHENSETFVVVLRLYLLQPGLDVCDIYFRYTTTSYNTNLSTVELADRSKT